MLVVHLFETVGAATDIGLSGLMQDPADEIRVVTEGGYLGAATRREIEYARERRMSITSVDPTLDL